MVRKWREAGLYPAVILAVNILIARKLFGLEYSANLASNEGEFIAIARQVAAHLTRPGDLLWWPVWDCGLPFQNTYLPLLPVLAGLLSGLTGHSAALSFHQVGAAAFCLGPVALYALAWGIGRSAGAAFFAALLYSVFSPCVLLVPAIRNDVGSLWNSRRLQILSYYGEAPHSLSLVFVPLAILFLCLAITRGKLWQQVLAGILSGAAVLANAFGAVILLLAGLSLLATVSTERAWKNLRLLAAIGVLTYLWISPLVPPSVFAAIRMNSPTIGADYRFTARSLAGVAILTAGFIMAWCGMSKAKWPAHLRFSALFALLTGGIVLLGWFGNIYVVPQPHRYQIAMDMAISLAVIFAAKEWLAKAPRRTGSIVAAVALAALAIEARHQVHYARGLIRSVDITRTVPYRVAQWVTANLDDNRVMIGGAYSFYFNDFTDTPQLHGGQEPMLPNFVMRIAAFTIYSVKSAEITTLWLKALGAHAILVPGPHSEEFYKPFSDPGKLNGFLPVLWQQDDDTIYSVPARSMSLAHVIDARSLVRDRPINGLDTAQIERYVKALDSPDFPEAAWKWNTSHSATIHASLAPGQVVSTQVTYHPGWHATWNGVAQPTHSDGLGLLVVQPACQGSCDLTLWFDGGTEWRLTLWASGAAMLAVIVIGAVRLRRR